MKEFFSNFLKSKQNEQHVKRAYAILMLSHSILADADDIEDVYNARKLFEYAFTSNNLTVLMNENPFIKLSKRNFEQLYKHRNLIKRGVLNQAVTKEVHWPLQELLTRIRNSVDDSINLYEHIAYVNDNKAEFISTARTSND